MVDNSQIFIDHGPDSFMAEVIQIMKIDKLHIDIAEHGWIELNSEQSSTPSGWTLRAGKATNILPNLNRVRVEFSGTQPATEFTHVDYHFHATAIGRSYGEALRKIRERIREDLGQ
jgi:hypothetical protein